MELIVTHSHTDFDALAAQLGARKLYPQALPLLSAQLNENVREFTALYRDELPFVHLKDLPDEPVTQLILVDTAVTPHLPVLSGGPIPTTIIDHHPLDRAPAPHEQIIHEETGATATILARRLLDDQAPLSPVEATLLLLGIYEDTGNLSRPGTRQVDVACAAWLLGQGARIEAVTEFLHRPLTQAQDRLYRQVEATLRVEEMNGWPVLLATARSEGTVPELSVLAEKLRTLYGPAVMALAIATADAGTQLILRSNGEALDAGALARRFGGGGHRAAAAAYLRGRDAAGVLAEAEEAIRDTIHPALSAADIMTTPVHTASIDDTIEQAEALFDRYDHGALPVLDRNGVVKGLIARRDLVRARRHGLRAAPVSRYMWHGPTLLSPDTPISTVRQALAAGNGDRTGRLLIVDAERRLRGIITRSDLVRALLGAQPAGRNGYETIADVLDQALAPAMLGLLRHAAAVAEAHGWALYAVGGCVRDMLLNRPREDLDLVVEGDAIGLAQALAEESGGQVRSHAQFGTATLELPEQGEMLPDGRDLDFVMARTEFYEHPSALPSVEAASLRHDLHRRDFTINTLAVCLNPSRYGRLYDFYGGRRDITRRLVRVLHNLSFIDDPTRMLRAARLAARLGFTIEPRTSELIADAVEQGVLGRTTPQRIVNELRLLLREDQPERAMALLDGFGILRELHPGLRWSAVQAARFAAARAAGFPGVDLSDLYLGIAVYELSAAERETLIARFRLAAPQIRLLRGISMVQERLAVLTSDDALRDSTTDRALRGISEPALRVAQLCAAPPAPAVIERYLTVLRQIKLHVDGAFLRRLGLKPGPRYGELLNDLRAARLDGLVHGQAEEEAWIRRMV